jgi:hypothetical protein
MIKYNQLINISNKKNKNNIKYNNSNNNNNNTCNRKNNNTIKNLLISFSESSNMQKKKKKLQKQQQIKINKWKNLLICFLDPLANIWLQVEERKHFDTFASKSPDGH